MTRFMTRIWVWVLLAGCAPVGNELAIDDDGDGFTEFEGDCDDSNALMAPVDADGDGFTSCVGDCNDLDAQVYPGAAPNDSLTDCMIDRDGDGFGSIVGDLGSVPGTDCNDDDPLMTPIDLDGDGISGCAGDCDERDIHTYPGAAPNDSDLLCMTDSDGDGYGASAPSKGASAGSDCDDGDPLLTPADGDGDGWSTCEGDCVDSDPTAFPGAAWNDDATACMRDADGDGYGGLYNQLGLVDGSDCDDTQMGLNGLDSDGDGATTCDGDCDDTDPSTHPGAAALDSAFACMTDHDGDGFGEASPPDGLELLTVEAGESFSCGLTTDHEVVCWGLNDKGQAAVFPAADPDDGEFYAQLSVGRTFVCALRAPYGDLVCQGEFYDDGCANDWRPFNNYVDDSNDVGPFYAIDGMGYTMCASYVSGGLRCFGNDDAYAACDGTNHWTTSDFAQVAVGYTHVIVKDQNNAYAEFGSNDSGCLNQPGNANRLLDLTAGVYLSCGINLDHGVQCWGDNTYGQLTEPEGL